ncbi:RHS repeat-associated core domain-containing protein [Acidovorax sp. GW101-3H11]|uniref:RHS repeat-associated core domain-containing protein n=1 Tax=Acidovorax sp. GW101-3H11 TaxID=1813946 RepID=UPI0018FEB621|nr:RHS repeat-associated core domain-containing protein [Acidovorax sp. GW101-3H11]
MHSDHLNTPRKLTQANGQAVWQWAYSAFGDEQPTTAAKRFTSEMTNPTTGATSTPEVTFNLRYPGQYFDKETNLHYNYFRTYAPGTGRYTQGDPIGLGGGFNRFAYVEGNPLSMTDPTGEIAFLPILIGIGAGYAFDYALEQYKKEHCTCKETPAGPVVNAAAGGAVGGSGPFASKPRGGVAGGGPAGRATSSFSQINHAAASSGRYSVATRNWITKVLRRLPYAGAALAGYELYDAFTCD